MDQQSLFPDLVDWLVMGAPRQLFGVPTPAWPFTYEFAVRRVTFGAPLLLWVGAEDQTRYTLFNGGAPYVLPPEMGKRLIHELRLTERWITTEIDGVDLRGALACWQITAGVAP